LFSLTKEDNEATKSTESVKATTSANLEATTIAPKEKSRPTEANIGERPSKLNL
jgi:hypothetical protein